MVFSTYSSAKKFFNEKYSFLIYDEVHHSVSEKMSKKVIKEISKDFLIGLTATPFRNNRSQTNKLKQLYSDNNLYPIVYRLDLIKALKEKEAHYLSKLKYYGLVSQNKGTIILKLII